MLSSADTWFQADPHVRAAARACCCSSPCWRSPSSATGVRTALDPRRGAPGCGSAPADRQARESNRRTEADGRPGDGGHDRLRRCAGCVRRRARPARCCPSSLYAVFYVAPGDPAQLACGPRCSPAQVAPGRASSWAWTTRVYTQYGHFLQGLVAGQRLLHRHRRPALRRALPRPSRTRATSRSPRCIADELPVTASLALGAMVLWLLPRRRHRTAVRAAARPAHRAAADRLTLTGTATPVFIIGLLLLMVFCA